MPKKEPKKEKYVNLYEARWVGYHSLLVLGVWIIAACTVTALFTGWGIW